MGNMNINEYKYNKFFWQFAMKIFHATIGKSRCCGAPEFLLELGWGVGCGRESAVWFLVQWKIRSDVWQWFRRLLTEKFAWEKCENIEYCIIENPSTKPSVSGVKFWGHLLGRSIFNSRSRRSKNLEKSNPSIHPTNKKNTRNPSKHFLWQSKQKATLTAVPS